MKYSICTLIVAIALAYLYISTNLNINKNRTAPVSGWNNNISRNTRHYVSSATNVSLIEPRLMCDSKVLLIIFVGSAPQNFEARTAIRATWKRLNYQPYFDIFHPKSEFGDKFLAPDQNLDFNEYLLEKSSTDASQVGLNFNVQVAFLMGKPSEELVQQRILNESLQFGDIIQEDFVDSYNNLTLKSIFMLKWVTNNCLDKVKFVMKCDDDSFINIPNLIHILLGGTIPLHTSTRSLKGIFSSENNEEQNRLQQNNILTGFMFSKNRPDTDEKSKCYSSSFMYNKEFYPDYLSGSGYLMSIDVAKKLYYTSLDTPLFHMEDVFITGIVADRAGIKRQNHPFFYWATTKDRCAMRGMISQHFLKPPNKLYEMFEFLTNTTTHDCMMSRTLRFIQSIWSLTLFSTYL